MALGFSGLTPISQTNGDTSFSFDFHIDYDNSLVLLAVSCARDDATFQLPASFTFTGGTPYIIQTVAGSRYYVYVGVPAGDHTASASFYNHICGRPGAQTGGNIGAVQVWGDELYPVMPYGTLGDSGDSVCSAQQTTIWSAAPDNVLVIPNASLNDWTEIPTNLYLNGDLQSGFMMAGSMYYWSGRPETFPQAYATVGLVAGAQALHIETSGMNTYRGLLAFVCAEYLDNGETPIIKIIDHKNVLPKYFEGSVREIVIVDGHVSIEVANDLEKLDIAMPRNLYMPGCGLPLYSAACGVLKSTYKVTGSITSGSTASILHCDLSNADAYFDNGEIEFSSGDLTGLSFSIKSYRVGLMTLGYPLRNLPAVGDTFNAYPGCNKTTDACTNKYGNLANFRGFPDVPIPESSYF